MLSVKNRQALIALLLTVFLVALVRTAWISDDAAITLRSVLNFLNGYGPTFNVDERVQAYTHPLWFFLITAVSLFVRNVFAATFILSIGVSLFALWLLLARAATNFAGAIIAGLALLLSKAYLDFATSGLENPLSHVLILAAVLLAIRAIEGGAFRDLLLFFLSCSLTYLNRPDLLVLLFPLAALVSFSAGRERVGQLLGAVLLGALPVVIWTGFSMYYYGFPFPNTAYAKLGTGIALDDRLMQGGRYVLHSARHDPLTVCFIAAGIVTGLAGGALHRALAAGIVSYLAYILSIGGDFMEGRFLTAPLLAAAIIVARSRLGRRPLQGLGAGVLLLGLANAHATVFSSLAYDNRVISPEGIADERGFYFQRFGLLTAPVGMFSAPRWVVGSRKTLVICGGLGYNGVHYGPGAHYIDECALADPLLARLPARFDPDWRIGHFTRQLPTNYRESIALQRNLLSDPATHRYYEEIRLITRGALGDARRLQAILRFNFGDAPRPPDREMYRHHAIPASDEPMSVSVARLNRVAEGIPWDAAGNFQFFQVLEVALASPRSFGTIDLSVDHNDTYRVEALVGAGWEEIATIRPVDRTGMARHRIALGRKVATARRIRITALDGDGLYSLGHLLLD